MRRRFRTQSGKGTMPSSLPSKLQLILTDAFDFYTQNFRQIAVLCLPFLFATALSQVVIMESFPASEMTFFTTTAVDLAIYPLYSAALIHFMERRARSEHPVNSELVSAALPHWGALLTLKLLTSLLIFFGISMLIIPGVWLWVRLVFAEFYLVLYRFHPTRAVERSIAATKGHFGPILMLLCLTYLPVFLAVIAIEALMQWLSGGVVLRIAALTSLYLVAQFVKVVLFRTFMEVVKEQSGGATDITV